MDEASIGMTVDRTEAHVSGTGKRTGVATPATGVMHGLVSLRSAHLENTFREYVSAGHSVCLQGSGLLPATLTLIFFIFRHVE